jgi:dGTPase
MKASVEIVALEPAATRYLVPEFEMHVFGDITGFEGWPWRAGDLLHIRKTQSTVFTADRLSKTAVRIYSRDPKRYRLFLREPLMADDPHAPDWVVVADGFRRTTSRRGLAVANLQWWTSDKRGGTFRQGARAEAAIKAWSSGCSRAQTVAILQEGGMVLAEANGLCEKLDQHLELWCTHAPPSVRGRPELSNHPGGSTLSSFATTVGRRLHGAKEDGYRAPFQRDRDRVVWSRGLRQLANKTQVFPIPSGDFLRHRLAHSLEVVQLASTIGASFGLDPYLIEAGGLAHDIGHTPFGHAGERALDQLLKEIGPLGGFNHYEHGVDIVRWLEDAYHSPSLGGIFGLNLTAEVAECIFKHMYGRGREEFGQTALYERSKHHDYFKDDSCHLEGQAVRIADKISYLVSDLEDGIRMGVFEEDDFLYCRLLRHPPLDLVPSDGESLHERFLSQRTILLKILMEDVIEATDCRLGAMAVASLDKIRSTHAYTVDHSAAMQTEVGEVWTLLQTGKLHKDARVKLANLRAERIVRDLTTLFAFAPELVDTRFREVHARLEGSPYMREYRERVGSSVQLAATLLRYIGTDERACKVPLRHLIQAKDYVASLPDTRASQLHAELLGSGAPWMP